MQTLTGPIIKNPGNGIYQIFAGERVRITSVSIMQPKGIDKPLVGVLTFSVGSASRDIDLSLGARTLGLRFPVPMLELDASGLNANDDFSIVLL